MNKKKILLALSIILILIASFWYGGNHPDSKGFKVGKEITNEQIASEETIDEEISNKETIGEDKVNKDKTSEDKNSEDKNSEDKINENEVNEEETKENKASEEIKAKDKVNTEDKSSKEKEDKEVRKALPLEAGKNEITDEKKTCYLTIKCDSILDNIDMLDKNKLELVPNDGIILAEREVSFYEGESVFNILLRELKREKIHFEYQNTPMYESAYIKGINNIYEFDCGELSGWMYKVNEWFPNYGVSKYALKQGDKIEILYTCNLGKDLGDNSLAGGE